jgi:hypothetical protein
MPTATLTRTVRWANLLCAPCQTAIIADGWFAEIPAGANLDDLLDMEILDRRCHACNRCRTAVARHIDTGGDITCFYRRRGLDRIMYNAVHEAAHTRVAQVLGATVERVEIVCNRAGRPIPTSGGTTSIKDIDSVSVDVFVPMYWSGQQADLHWLAEHGLDTDADRLDAREGGLIDVHMAVAVIKHYHPTANVDTLLARGRARADQLVKQHWSEILDLAGRLAVEGVIIF